MFRYTKAHRRPRSDRLDHHARDAAAVLHPDRHLTQERPGGADHQRGRAADLARLQRVRRGAHHDRTQQHPDEHPQQRDHHRRRHLRPGAVRLGRRLRDRPPHPPVDHFTYYLVLIAIILPAQLGTVPLYIGARSVGLTGNAIGMILLWIGILLPLSVFLYASFFRGLSTEYEEAAVIDGATPDAGVLPRRAAADGAGDRNRRDPRGPDRLERLLQLADLPRRLHDADAAGRDVHLRRRPRLGVEQDLRGRDHLDDPDPGVLHVRAEAVHPGLRRWTQGLTGGGLGLDRLDVAVAGGDLGLHLAGGLEEDRAHPRVLGIAIVDGMPPQRVRRGRRIEGRLEDADAAQSGDLGGEGRLHQAEPVGADDEVAEREEALDDHVDDGLEPEHLQLAAGRGERGARAVGEDPRALGQDLHAQPVGDERVGFVGDDDPAIAPEVLVGKVGRGSRGE